MTGIRSSTTSAARSRRGSLTALVGPNGAGKSTLLKAIAGLLPVTAGAIRFGIDRRAVAYLPQVVDVDRSFPLRVIDVVDFGHWRKVGALRRLDAQDRAASVAAIAAVGLAGLENQPIGRLSVGQFQRVLFARLMVQEAAVILLDEPFNAIDQKTTADLMQVVRALAGRRPHGDRRPARSGAGEARVSRCAADGARAGGLGPGAPDAERREPGARPRARRQLERSGGRDLRALMSCCTMR